MAPKRSSGRKVVASVVKTTRRVVEVVIGAAGKSSTTKTTTSDQKEIVEEVIDGGGDTETVETTTTTTTNTALETPPSKTTTTDIPVKDVEATTKAGKRSQRVVEKSPERAPEEEERISMGEEETETETQEPEFPMDDPKIYEISTPPRVEGSPKKQVIEEAQTRGKRTRTAQSEEVKTQKGRKRRRRMGVVGEGREGYKRYIHRVLKQVHPDLGISGKAMTVVNNFMTDMFERLAFEAGKLSDYGGRRTMTASEVQSAVKLVLPGELGKHAVAEGSKAVVTYKKGNS